jgi:hypothetical protein
MNFSIAAENTAKPAQPASIDPGPPDIAKNPPVAQPAYLGIQFIFRFFCF